MDDLLGSGSSILNGLRDQRSTLKVCVRRTQHRADSTLDQEGEFFPFSYQGVSNSARLIVDKVLMADTIQFNDSQMKCRQE